MHDVAKLRDSLILLSELEQSESLFQLRRGSFVSGWKVLQYLVVILDRFVEFTFAKLDFRQVELGISRQVSTGIILDVVGEFLDGEIILAGVVIPQSIVVKHVRRWHRRLRLLLRLLGSKILL